MGPTAAVAGWVGEVGDGVASDCCRYVGVPAAGMSAAGWEPGSVDVVPGTEEVQPSPTGSGVAPVTGGVADAGAWPPTTGWPSGTCAGPTPGAWLVAAETSAGTALMGPAEVSEGSVSAGAAGFTAGDWTGSGRSADGSSAASCDAGSRTPGRPAPTWLAAAAPVPWVDGPAG